jgi:DNA-binding SARP family transcriptional activator/tetratricopeptide (TPR) repeat protein
MDFRILGPLEVLDDGRTLPLPGSKPRALLALFLLHPNETLTTDRLIDELWGERAPAGAAKTLQMQISRLRKALAGADGSAPGGPIVTRERGYELVLDRQQLDSHRFERLLAQGRTELAGGRAESAVDAFEEALALWRGDPLADLFYEPFALPEIARLDDLRIATVEQLIEAKLALARHAEVVEQLEALIEEHPYRERLRAQLMLALYRCDRQADALQAYHDARTILVEELGIEPGERLRALERAILAQDHSLQLVAPDERPAGAPPADTRRAFVGRAGELAQLVAALDDAFAGRGRLILLAGEPGIGKSRLADALAEHARARGAGVLVGRCWEAGGAPAYWPWIQALRIQIADTEPEALRAQLGAGAADLAQLIPEVRERLPQLPEPALTGEGARFRLFQAASSFLRSAAQVRPLVVVLDDLHAADEPSLLLLRYLARELNDSRLLVVGAYRDVDPTLRDALTSAVAELVREPHTAQIGLAGLTTENVAEYVELSTAIQPAPSLVEAIHAETEGNALFVSEVVHLLAAEGRVDEADAQVRIPPGVRAVIGRRLARLSADCQALLVPAAVMGREFGLEALTELSRLGLGELMDVLNEAMTERVLDDVPGAPARVRFGHALIRDTLYDGLTAARRMQLHREVGEALEVVYARDPEPHLAELAQHFVAAAPIGVADKAIEYAGRAGDRAAEQLAFEEAARHYEIALTLVDDQVVRCELLLALGDAEARAGDSPASKQAFREAAELAERGGLAEHLARAALGYGGRFAWVRASAHPDLVPLLERALSAIDERESLTRVSLLVRLAASARDDPSRDRRVRLAEEALDIARRSGDPVTLAAVIEGHWIAVEGPELYLTSEAVEVADKLISLGEQTGDKERVFAGHDHRLHCLWVRTDRAGVDAELEAMRTLADELRQPAQHWHVGTGQTMLALMDGRFEEAEQLLADTLAVGDRAESWNAAVSYRLGLFVLRREQGRLAELEDTITQSVDEYPSLPRFRSALAHLYGELGREHEARALLDVLSRELAGQYLDAEWLFTIALLADACARVGDQESAQRLYSMLLPYERLYAQAPVEAAFGSLARALGVLATTLRRFSEAEGHFDMAIETERRMGARPWLAHAQHDLAAMLLARGAAGDAERARTLLEDVLATYRELGMDSWAARAQTLAAGTH